MPQSDLLLMRRMDELHLEYPFAGSRMLRDLLSLEGHPVGRTHVRTLMRRMGIQAIYRKKNTSESHPEHRIYPYLLRRLPIEQPNQVWAADITYLPMARGFVYLVAIMDWYTRKVLAWRLSNTLTTDFCVEAPEDAVSRYPRPEIFNTDQGSSPVSSSLRCSSSTTPASAWMVRDVGATTCSSSDCGNRSSTKRCTCTPTTVSVTLEQD